MMFSKACEYAIKSSVYIGQRSLALQKVNVGEISRAVSAPEAFTAKILQQLCKAGILESVRGKQGGFYFLEEKLHHFKIYDIIRVIDGEGIFSRCGLGLKECSNSNPCPVHQDYKSVRENLFAMAQKFSLYDLAQKTEQGLFRLKV